MSEEKHPQITALWRQILEKTDGILPQEAVTKWLPRIVPITQNGSELVLAVPDAFTKQFIEQRYLVLLSDAAHAALDAAYTFRLVVDPSTAPNSPAPRAHASS